MWCHLSPDSGERYTNADIRKSPPLQVGSFRELVPLVARIANHNPDYSLFFRGQAKDYTIASGATSAYPTIFRKPGGTLKGTTLRKRFEKLDAYSQKLIEALEKQKFDGIDKLRKFPELQWSILQHYEVCATPLLDLTHSLRVAASFALNDGGSSAPVVTVFALPHPQGTITYSTEDELLNVRLLSASPYKALRPHFQEGYLVGSFPVRATKKHASLDFGGRLVAKFELSTHGFWSEHFHAIPREALYPDDDTLLDVCNELAL